MKSDEELLIIFNKTKNQSSFDELHDRYKNLIYKLIFNIVLSHHTTEDVLQQVFIKLFQNSQNFKFKSSFKTWLIRIAINESLNEKKKEKASAISINYKDIDNENNQMDMLLSYNPEQAEENKKMLNIIKKNIEKLDDKYRVVFILKDIQGYSYQEVSDILNLPVSTIKSRHHRSRLFIRDDYCQDIVNSISDLKNKSVVKNELEEHLKQCSKCSSFMQRYRKILQSFKNLNVKQ